MVWSKGIRATVKVVFDNDDYIECTPDHEFLLSDGSYKKAKDLVASDSLAALNKRLINDYLSLSITGSRKLIAEHNAVFEMKFGQYPTILTSKRNTDSTVAHHVDHVKWNNHPDNIQTMTLREHSTHHSTDLKEMQQLRARRMKGTTWEEFYGEKKAREIRTKYVAKRKGTTPWNKGINFSKQTTNHKVVRVEESIEQEVFDIAMPEYHNFVANGVFVHNCWHPDILEFIAAKQQPGRLTKFNVSVNCTDEFMERIVRIQQIDRQIIEHQQSLGDSPVCGTVLLNLTEARATLDEWNLVFPDTTSPAYKKEWQGDIRAWKAKGYPVKLHNVVSATGLWDLLMESTYKRAEPGILFLDRANHFLPLNYAETVYATNPSMPAGTLVHTKGGIFPIEVLDGQEFLVKSLDGEWAPARCRLSGENEELLEISFGTNRTVRSTKKHRWPVYDARMERLYKVDARELRVGDLIPLNRNEDIGVFGDMSLTYDEGFFVGYLTGDGWFTHKGNNEYNVGITFGKHERSMAERVLAIVNSLKSVPSTLSVRENTGEIYLQFTTRQLVDKMLSRYKLIPSVKTIPDSVWQGNDQYIKGFVDGLLSADGCVSDSNNNLKITLTTSREELAQGFAKLLSFAGVPTMVWNTIVEEVSFPNGKDYDHSYDRWDVAVSGKAVLKFAKVFDITHPDKHQRLENIISRVCNKRDHRALEFVEVVSVKSAGTAKVWDISVLHNQHVFPTEWCYTGNCGEQTLAPGGVCNLGSLNLTQFINADRSGFDLEKVAKYTAIMVRFLDDINDLTKAPLPEYEWNIRNKRRVGVGILGWGSALYMLKTKFASEEAGIFRDQVMTTIARAAYMASIDLAVEKGMFFVCRPEKHLEGPFVKQLNLPSEYLDKMMKYGIRNSSLLSIQPTGNTSILANVVSGGLEPVFMHEYIRTVIVGHMPAEFADQTPKWYEGEWHETKMFKFTKEGDEEILKGKGPDGTVYKIDKNRGLTREVLCQDYGVRYMKRAEEWDGRYGWTSTAMDLSVNDHLNDLKGFAPYVDSAMSKCVAEGTLISTNKGLKPIEALGIHSSSQEGFVVPCDNFTVLDENGEEKDVTQHYFGGIKPCATVRFNNGFKLTAAYTHKLRCATGWKPLADIKVGDKVFYRTNAFVVDRPYISPPQPTFAPNAKHTTFPQVVDEDFALLLGMWVADGSLTDHSVSICEKNENVNALCKRLMVQLFNTHHVQLDTRWGVKTHYVHSSSIARWFKREFGHGAANKRLPQWLLDSPVSVWKAFVEGLTLDGYLKKTEGATLLVVFDGYAKDVAEKLTYMLSTMGVQYYLLTRTAGNEKTTYGVIAWLTDTDTIVPVEDHKKAYNPQEKAKKQTYISNSVFEQLITQQPHNTSGSIIRARLRKCQQRDNFVRMSFVDKLGIEFDRNLTCVVVTDIVDVGEKRVYDIEVKDTHSYLINGVVSHNTINVPNDYLFEEFKNIYLDAYKSGYVKGVTTYRAGTMTTVLAAKDEKNATDMDEEIILEDVKLPDSAPATMKTLKAEGRKWYLTVLWWDDQKLRPFGFFVHTNSHEKTTIANDAVECLTALAKRKGIPPKHIDKVHEKIEVDNNITKIARMISLNLRHGVLIKNIVSALDGVDNATVGTFLFAIKKYLSSFIKDGEQVEGKVCEACGSTNILYSEGCHKCGDCGSSKCG